MAGFHSSWRKRFSGLKQQEEAEKSALEARDMKPDFPPIYFGTGQLSIFSAVIIPRFSKDLDAYLKTGAKMGPRADPGSQDTSRTASSPAGNEGRRRILNMRRNYLPPPEPDLSGFAFPSTTCPGQPVAIGMVLPNRRYPYKSFYKNLM